MTDGDLLAQEQAQARAGDGHVVLGGKPAEASEQKRQVIARYAEAVVADAHRGHRVATAHRHAYLPALGGVLESVVQEVGDDGPDPRPVALDHQWDVGPGHHKELTLGQRPKDVELLRGDVSQVEAVAKELEAVVLQARRFQHLLDQQVHLGQLRVEDAGDRWYLVGRDGAVLEHRVVPAQNGQRATELVRREVEELGLGPFEVGHPLGMRAQLHSLAVALDVALDLLPPLLGEVARPLAEAAEGTRLVAPRGDDDAGPESCPALADPPAFLLVSALAPGHLELPARLAVPSLLAWVKH